MSIYLLLYFIVGSLIAFIWIYTFKKYWKYSYWKYFFASTFSFFTWLIIYLLSFTITYDKDILLIFSRLLYSIFLLWLYFMLFFIILFNNKNNYLSKIHIIIVILSLLFLIIWVFTPFIIEDLKYSTSKNIYIEKYWILYFLNAILYLISPFLIIIFSYIKLKKLNTINKIRLKYISLWFLTFCLSEWLILVVFPLFNIWILQKQQILFFIPFIIWTWYSINRYHFINIRIWIWKIITYLLSILLAILSTFLIYKSFYYYYKSYAWNLNLIFWKQTEDLSEGDLILYILISILLFILFNKIINNLFKYDTPLNTIINKINRLKQEIPFITNLSDLNKYLETKFKKIFNVKYLEIKLNISKSSEINKYFSENKLNNLFINDTVFIEENKNKFNSKLKEEINTDSYLIFPIKNNKNKLVGTFNIWSKSFKDSYYSEEIELLREFICFLEWHIKYMWIYSEINNLNLYLDQKVDKKTIEYNTLINKQREFIWYISHEVKTPIANSIFQIDCMINDTQDWNYNKDSILKWLNIINSGLLKSWNLLNKLFEIEKYDINKCKLFKEKVNVNKLLEEEIDIFKKINTSTYFNLDINKKEILLNLDIIQFTQVIDNLINNAIQFSDKEKPIINVEYFLKSEYIYIVIEDNWTWLKNIDIKSIFDKYATWEGSSVWLWMWLYLCKKIVELHWWTIKADKSKTLWWAKFTIKLKK